MAPPPPPPPPILFPFGSKHKRRLSWSTSTSTYSPTSTLATADDSLTFHFDTEKYDEVPRGLLEFNKDSKGKPKPIGSNTPTGTKKSTVSSKWGVGWGLGKQKDKQVELKKDTTESHESNNFQQSVSPKWGYGWDLGKQKDNQIELKKDTTEFHESNNYQQSVGRDSRLAQASRSTQRTKDTYKTRDTHKHRTPDSRRRGSDPRTDMSHVPIRGLYGSGDVGGLAPLAQSKLSSHVNGDMLPPLDKLLNRPLPTIPSEVDTPTTKQTILPVLYPGDPYTLNRLREGFWNRRGDHLTPSGFIVYAPSNMAHPAELRGYPNETEGYKNKFNQFVPYSERPELLDSLPRYGAPPLRPYESFITYSTDK